MTTITPFKIAISEDKLADLQRRLAATVLAGEVVGAGWAYGPSQAFITGMIERLRHGFDWRGAEAAINRHPQFVTEIDGQTIHFLHVKAGGAGATPLLLLHGWPQHSLMWHTIAPILAERFTVITPDLRGAGGSSVPPTGYDKKTMAADMHELIKFMGYDNVFVAGYDLGSSVAYSLAARYPGKVARVVSLSLSGVDARTRTVFSDLARLYFTLPPEDFFRLLYPWLFSPAFLRAPPEPATSTSSTRRRSTFPRALWRRAGTSAAISAIPAGPRAAGPTTRSMGRAASSPRRGECRIWPPPRRAARIWCPARHNRHEGR